jgi:hypothetical protein
MQVAETVQHFITAMDAVKLEQRAVDEIQPLISDLTTRSVADRAAPALLVSPYTANYRHTRRA